MQADVHAAPKRPILAQLNRALNLIAGPVEHTDRIACLELPMKLESEMNDRCHWAKRYKRFQTQKRLVMLGLQSKLSKKPRLPLIVELTRIGTRGRALDTDNLQSSAKAVRDAIATFLGVDDSDPRIEWRYAQGRGPRFVVRIELLTPPRKI